jgi:hypothetical protein
VLLRLCDCAHGSSLTVFTVADRPAYALRRDFVVPARMLWPVPLAKRNKGADLFRALRNRGVFVGESVEMEQRPVVLDERLRALVGLDGEGGVARGVLLPFVANATQLHPIARLPQAAN